MSDYENNFGLALQTMTFELMCRSCDGCQPRAMELPLFLATPDMMFTLYGIFMSYVVDEMDMTIHVAIDYDKPRAEAIKILDDMKKILCNIDVTATSTLPTGYDLQAFRTAVGRTIAHEKDLVETYEAHYDAYAEAINSGVGGAQLVSGLLLYEGQIDTQNLEGVQDFWEWDTWTTTRSYLYMLGVTCSCSTLSGVAFYMLSHPLTAQEQYHYYLSEEPGLGQLVYGLGYIDSIMWNYDDMVSQGGHVPEANIMAYPVYTRILILLAWARLNILQPVRIEGHDITDENDPLPAGCDVLETGNNDDEPFNSSAWGSPKSIILVVHRDIARLTQWAPTLQGTHMEGMVRTMIRVATRLADRIGQAADLMNQFPTREIGRAMAVRSVFDPLVSREAALPCLLLKTGANRVGLHAAMAAENWQV